MAVLSLAGLVAGCSSDVARFDDGFYTGAVPKQPIPRQAMAQNQPYPSQSYPGDIDQVNTGSVNRGSGFGMPMYGNNPGAGVEQQPVAAARQPYGNGGYGQAPMARTASVERTMLPPPSAPANAAPTYSPQPPAMPQPVAAAPAMASPRAPAASTPPTKAGWQNTGNYVTLRNGETIDALSQRYGVPAKAILSANNMTNAGQAQPGQQISIPTYSYGQSPSAARSASAKPGQTLGSAPGPLRAPTANTAPAARAASLIVEPGDSLNGIARRAGVSVADLRAANGLTDDNIRIGQKLVMPNGAVAPKRVASNEPKPAMQPAPAMAAPAAAKPAAQAQPKPYEAPHAAPTKTAEAKPVAAAPVEAAAPAPTKSVSDETENDVATAAPAGTGISQFRWPVQGRVLKRYGEKSGARRNDGVDISVPRGTPVKAAENGVVIYAGDGLKEFGNTVLIKHDNGLVTVYGHADDLKVKRGETVRRGEEIATAGVSGDAESPMVHFEVRKNSAPVDPMTYLK